MILTICMLILKYLTEFEVDVTDDSNHVQKKYHGFDDLEVDVTDESNFMKVHS